jgi:alkaline phosphatase D
MTYKAACVALLFVIQSVLLTQTANAEKLVAGPMAGPSAMRSVTIWVQSDSTAKARLEYWTEKTGHKSSRSIDLKQDDDFAGRITLENLEPGTKYQYRVLLNNKPAESQVHQIATETLWQWRTDPPSSKVLLGSCAYINEGIFDRPNNPYDGGYDIFGSMAAAKPDLTIWMGDNVYFREVDYDSPSGMAYRYRHDRALPQLQVLLSTGGHAAIWDDHDYGANDSNSSFVFKADALTLFKRYWANPSYGLPDALGVFTVVHHNDADFFMLDDRWYRDGDRAEESGSKTMLGERQMTWLKDALLSSTANFKIIVAGGQMLNEQNRWEGWLNFVTERRKFLDWLSVHKIDGVMFASGDRHQTELFRMTRSDNYPLYELTCSPLTAGTHNIDGEQNNPMRVPGTLVGERNYCSMEFSGPYKERQVMVRSYSAGGKMLWEQKIMKQEISKVSEKK